MPSSRMPLCLLVALAAAHACGVARAEDATASVAVSDKGCEPMRLAVRPGKTTFAVRNVSGRKIEWEILNGVNVVEERENIIPGFTVRVTAKLDAGEYLMTCGLLNNPKGTLSVAAEQ